MHWVPDILVPGTAPVVLWYILPVIMLIHGSIISITKNLNRKRSDITMPDEPEKSSHF